MKEIASKRRILFVSLLIVNLMFTSAVLTIVIVDKFNESNRQDRFTLYIGTNDKDTNLQEISIDECQKRVEAACLQYVSGFTITQAKGAWTDDAGNIVHEKTLVCCIDGIAEKDINAIVDQLLFDLNQSSIMIEHEKLNCTFRGR